MLHKTGRRVRRKTCRTPSCPLAVFLCRCKVTSNNVIELLTGRCYSYIIKLTGRLS